ncbi:MAG: response regulator [Verrucomicrobia bacterium]|nr:response regulator [Verrucomicrobiota bacterium]MDA1086913.1 response regulator [Verrucomicrobiota bacterium]
MKRFERRRILLVDDDRNFTVSLSNFLSYENFDVFTASDGEEAIRQLDKARPDLIILDMSMPGMGGLGFLRQIIDASGKTRYPVLVLTARAEMKDFFDNVEVDGFLDKTCAEEELIASVRDILVTRAAAGELKTGRARVLLGENNQKLTEELKGVFSTAGYDIHSVPTGPEVLEAAAANHPHAILLNRILPNLNGNIAVTLIRAMPSLKDVPIVVYHDSGSSLGGSGGGAGREGGAITGANAVLSTSEPAALLDAVRSAIHPRDS